MIIGYVQGKKVFNWRLGMSTGLFHCLLLYTVWIWTMSIYTLTKITN